MRYSYLYGEGVPEDLVERVYADAIRVAERQLAHARRMGRTYSSYAAWAERLERELDIFKRLNPSPSPSPLHGEGKEDSKEYS